MPETDQTRLVPNSLRLWFLIHCLIDILFAIPLLIAPVFALQLFGWETIDPATTRLVGAALMAIGVESWLVQSKGIEAFREMLNLKLIWSSCATVGIVLSIRDGAPPMAWLFLTIFAAFFVVWFSYRLRIK